MNEKIILKYKGRSATGEKVTGQFVGEYAEFQKQLQSRGILLLQVKEVRLKRKKGAFTAADFLMAIEQLYHLLTSGMRLDIALQTIMESLQKEKSLRFWQRVLDGVKQGELFSQAIVKGSEEAAGWQVPQLYSSMIAIGEEVGDIGSSLKRLLAHMEFRKSLKSEMISALSYPAFLIVMSIAAIVIVVMVIVPRFATVFQPDELANLPLVSRIVFSLGDLSGETGQIIMLFFMALLLLAWLWQERLKPVISNVFILALHGFPLTRKPLQHLDLADIYTALGAMLEGGIGLHHSLTQAAKVARVPALAFLLDQTAIHVKEGQSIHSLWAASNLVPPEDVSLVAVGESSAGLGKICLRLGQRHMEQFRLQVRGLMSLFEPVMILCLGCAIGFVVTGILLAVLSMTDVVAL
ncbi:type II secretion system F family protein [Desulfocapsa sp. AH-315-G09]|uniref:Type II secretion system F family protein n=1 Tax=Desulfotalea psychrophila TaxID=84980 RepID=A0ABS3AV96_9BACT|nr:type II secretion system F family protein [Desulfocapsa sp.]MBN4063954.1 type II secretion system F family protein [bacterium AH-315-I07]MBN4065430.1 type II secretion system F family protein [Desulfocapsa sp. AH-315-G09]MBN4068708.1 type II secretion system F family protein [Desulfotalea psychrophila]